jgi:uncharacterized protein (DUF849 family)
VGFEDSHALGGGSFASRNVELVLKVRTLIEQLGRAVATPGEARTRYGIAARAATTAVATSV